MNILSIDTSDTKKAKVYIKCDSKTFKVSDSRETRSDITLSLIEKVLKISNLKISDIDKLCVNEGPGSFTGLRVGISIANALSFSIGKPINGQIFGKIISPVY
ncbi:MAG: tRNA (adenosine(37)-N6)-threonylcarbamoyltransferase complex dimerization subunit type 1 TsaB [Candidatus Levybacteria bacterium CG_4_10_14_0_2_um_filter_36_16]|nr:MAG: tRNA (adenosine(37)-N6)-threonylcarbamoyltransferase complex dimerization subunit type 1 TsaB [Candidatus Levybacteria bacterium CG2_30_37_29]PIZ97986.1 MAG: tRNA (adenosine(37)-N6)-threonylcarbamoyltransferase complex dimerization subunit type 1 TsaB [Candidatus Levybacteria bacterium CG_4_10_14_0_2_um_filter_36_16]